jgi:hypothetical protein
VTQRLAFAEDEARHHVPIPDLDSFGSEFLQAFGPAHPFVQCFLNLSHCTGRDCLVANLSGAVESPLETGKNLASSSEWPVSRPRMSYEARGELVRRRFRFRCLSFP